MQARYSVATVVDWKKAQEKAAQTARWAVTMAKVRIRRVASRTRWQLVTFYGKSGAESVGVVDMRRIGDMIFKRTVRGWRLDTLYMQYSLD